MTKPKAKQLAPERSISTFPPSVTAKKGKPTVKRAHPDGYFVALIKKHNWPPGFESQLKVDRNGHLQALARANRAVALVTGKGWGNGTIVMANTPKHVRPDWLKKETA